LIRWASSQREASLSNGIFANGELLLTSSISILRLVRYGNVPLPRAGEHFHVLQSHGNRYMQETKMGVEKSSDTVPEDSSGIFIARVILPGLN